MPTVNIPPRLRFTLYLIAAVSLMVVAYAVDKAWAGDAEVRLVTSLAALLNLLAAAKTDISHRSSEPVPTLADVWAAVDEVEVRVGNVVNQTATAARRKYPRPPQDDDGGDEQQRILGKA